MRLEALFVIGETMAKKVNSSSQGHHNFPSHFYSKNHFNLHECQLKLSHLSLNMVIDIRTSKELIQMDHVCTICHCARLPLTSNIHLLRWLMRTKRDLPNTNFFSQSVIFDTSKEHFGPIFNKLVWLMKNRKC